MNRNLLWRGGLIAAILLILGISAYPLDEKIKLGLDLQGGMHLVLQVETEDALRADTESDMERIVRVIEEEADLVGLASRRTGMTSFLLTGADDETGAVAEVLEEFGFDQTWRWNATGEGLAFSMRDDREAETRRMAVAQAVQTIRNRVDAFGVSEPVITEQPDEERIVVQLPGVDDPERVKRLIKNTAFLEFRIVEDVTGPGNGPAVSREALVASYGGQVPPDVEIVAADQVDPVSGQVTGQVYYALEATSGATGRDLKNARPGTGQFGEPVVLFSFNAEGADKFGDLTGANVGRGLAIVLDGKVVSAPRINSQIRDSGQIEGDFTQQEVQDLVTTLRSGALPAGLEYLEERTVGPSLGQDSIDQGLKAGWVGGLLVILTMLIVYRLSGINAVIVLSMNVVLVFGALAYLGATLTLPGIAGIILTIGMAVDANVLVFERIKEELRRGKTVKSAIEAGFANARSSIFDANITTLIAALFLFQFGTGPIRGFAATLTIGIASSIFTALFVSRWLFDLQTARRTRIEKLSI